MYPHHIFDILISQLCRLECTHCENPQNGLFRHFAINLLSP